MMLIKYRMLLAGAASAFTLIACSSGGGGAGGKDPVAATVNGTPISERLVGLMLKQRTDLGRPASAEARAGFIDRMAMQLVIVQEAMKKGLDKVPEVSDKLELSRQSILVEAFVQDYFKTNPISADELNAEYERYKAQAAGTEYKARHILVEKEAEAKDIIARLKKDPKAFEALAKDKSKDNGSKDRGGDLGWFDPRGMVPEFRDAVTQMAKGKFSAQPVKSQFGYHVILLEDSKPKQLQSFEQMKSELTQRLQQQKLKNVFDEMKAKAKIDVAQAPAPVESAPAKAGPAEPAKN